MSDAAREMSLDEWVARLPDGHRAKRELAELRARVRELAQSKARIMPPQRPEPFILDPDDFPSEED